MDEKFDEERLFRYIEGTSSRGFGYLYQTMLSKIVKGEFNPHLKDIAKLALKFEKALIELDFDTLRVLRKHPKYDKLFKAFIKSFPHKELMEDNSENIFIILNEEKLLPGDFNLFYIDNVTPFEFPFVTLKYFLGKGYDINAKNSFGENLLFALDKHNIPLMLFLLENGIAINDRNNQGNTILYDVVRYSFSYHFDYYDFVKLLLDFGADIYLGNSDRESVYSFITEGYEQRLRKQILEHEEEMKMYGIDEELTESEIQEQIEELIPGEFKEIQKLIFDYIDQRKIRVGKKIAESGKMIKPLANIVTDYLGNWLQ